MMFVLGGLTAGLGLRAEEDSDVLEYTYTNGENYAGTFGAATDLMLSVPGGASATQSGAISGIHNIVVNSDPVNTGTLTFTGANTYEGDTQVAHGDVALSGPDATIVTGSVTAMASLFLVSGSHTVTVGSANVTGTTSLTVANGGRVVTT